MDRRATIGPKNGRKWAQKSESIRKLAHISIEYYKPRKNGNRQYYFSRGQVLATSQLMAVKTTLNNHRKNQLQRLHEKNDRQYLTSIVLI